MPNSEEDFIASALLMADNMVDYCEKVKNAVTRLRSDTIEVRKSLMAYEESRRIEEAANAEQSVRNMEMSGEGVSIFDAMKDIRSSDQDRLREFQESLRHAANYSSIDAYCGVSDMELAHYLMECLGAYMQVNGVGMYGSDQLAGYPPDTAVKSRVMGFQW